MSKYTMQLRTIIENDINIFDFDYPFYDESKRADFQNNFINHFYMREIGSETIGLFKHYLKDTFKNVFPYYNELFKVSQLELDRLNNHITAESLTREVDGTMDGNSSVNGTSNNTDSRTSKHFDTPQANGSLTDNYLSDGSTQNGTDNNTSSSSGENHNTSKNTETLTRTVTGNRTQTPTENIKKYIELQKTLQQIEQNFFNDCNDLFMQIY